MKKLYSLIFLLLFTGFTTLTMVNCRDTSEKKDSIEEVGEEMEEAAEDVGDAVDETADDVEDEVEDLGDDN